MAGGVTEADFRALARSSPWRWQSVRFTASWTGSHAGSPVRAWIERPNRMRVEDLDGAVLQDAEAPPLRPQSAGSFGWSVAPLAPLSSEPGLVLTAAQAAAALPPPQQPRLRPDGLVAQRLDYIHDYDAPMYQNYHWVAMLDPRELTDGADPDAAAPDEREPDGTRVEAVRVVDHYGRPAWEAVLTPSAFYAPRCSCCPLLNCAGAADEYLRPDEPRQAGGYATRFLARLDVTTGICVRTEELDGPHLGAGHEVRIEAMDSPIPARR